MTTPTWNAARAQTATEAAAVEICRFAEQHPRCHVALVARNIDCAIWNLVDPLLRAPAPAVRPTWNRLRRRLTWPNGSIALVFTSPDHIRAYESAAIWFYDHGLPHYLYAAAMRSVSAQEPLIGSTNDHFWDNARW
jgi:phage terminase large subunit-like protein